MPKETVKEKKLQATYDFSKVGRTWQDEWSLLAERASSASVTLQRTLRKQKPNEDDDDYEEYTQVFYDAKDKSIAEIRELSQLQPRLIAQVLGDVPREWLLPDAPEDIDWHNQASLNYIQLPHYDTILNDLQSGKARAKAKN